MQEKGRGEEETAGAREGETEGDGGQR